MRKIPSAANDWSRALACVCGALLLLAAWSPLSAEEQKQNLKDGARRAGHATGAAARDVGQGAKKAGKEIGQGAKEAGKAIGGAAKEGGKEFLRAVKGEKR